MPSALSLDLRIRVLADHQSEASFAERRRKYIGGPINGALFLAWVRQQLVPTPRRGDIAVVDHLSVHHVADAICDAEASVLYLPPHSPDLYPSENVFAKVKHHLRKLRPRTKSDCDMRCGKSFDWFSHSECRNHFSNAGYASMD